MKTSRILVALLFSMLLGWGQQRISLDLQDITLEEALNKVAQASGERIIVVGEMKEKVNASVKRATVEGALNLLTSSLPKIKWVKVSLPAEAKFSPQELLLTVKTLRAINFSGLVLEEGANKITYTKGSVAISSGKGKMQTLFLVWREEETPSLSLQQLQMQNLSTQDYLNLYWQMLNAFLSLDPQKRKEVLFGTFNMLFQDPVFFQRLMQEYTAMFTSLTPEEMRMMFGQMIKVMQNIPPQFWIQMGQAMMQMTQEMMPILQEMAPQLQEMMPPNMEGGAPQQ